jgi:hypothetical protein
VRLKGPGLVAPEVKMTELTQSLRNRVYYAARDGMAITLYALLNEKSDEEVHELLNQVKVEVTLHFITE